MAVIVGRQFMQNLAALHHDINFMRKLFLIASILIIPTISFGQRYYSKEIIKKTDSIMKAAVGERIFNQYFHYDTQSYYEYKNFWGNKDWKTLTDTKRTKGKFKNMRVRYLFCLDTFNISCLMTWVQLDSNLNKIDSVDISFIPDYVLENKSCNFINDKYALQIAQETFTKKGIKPVSISLSYDRKKNIYYWRADNVLTENTDSFDSKYGQVQYVDIDALTGKVIAFFPDAIYAPVR